MMKGQTTSSQPAPIGTTDLSTAFINSFNQDAKDLFKIRANHLVHQWNEMTDDKGHLYNTIELLALLDLKEAQENPCGQFFLRQAAAVRYFGLTCENKDVISAINKMISAVNDMAKNKWLKASLYNLGMLEFAYDPLTPSTKKFAIFSYLVVDPKYEKDVTNLYGHLEFREGQVPSEFK